MSSDYTRAVINAVTGALQDWFMAVNVSSGSIVSPSLVHDYLYRNMIGVNFVFYLSEIP